MHIASGILIQPLEHLVSQPTYHRNENSSIINTGQTMNAKQKS